MSDKEKFEVDRNEDPVSYSSGMHSDWRFGGSNLANSSVGFVGLGNNSMNVSRGDLIGSSSCSSASMVDSLSPNYWENPTSSQKLGFCDINNVHNNGGSSSTVAIRKDGFGFGRVGQDHHGTLEMGWNHANSMLPNGPVMFPHSLSQFPTDSGFIERAARFSCFSGGNFGDMVNSYGIAQSMGLYGARDAIAGHGLKSVIAGGQSQGGDMNVVEDVPPSVEHLVAAKGSPLKSDRRSEGHVIFQDEGKQSLVRNANESDRAESSDDGGGQDDSPMLEGTSGEPSSKGLNSKKRKRSGRDGDNDKANGAQELPSEGAKGNSENQQKGDQQPISTANKACGKNAKLGSQASDPPKEEYIHVRARRGQATNSHSLAEKVKEAKEDKKEDGVKEAKEDKKEGVEEATEDKKEDGVEEVNEDRKEDGVGEVKEDKEVDGVSCVKEVEEDGEVDGVKKVEDKKGDELKEIEEDKKDDHISENDKMDEDTEIKETMEGEPENGKEESEKPVVDAMEVEGGIKEKEESKENEKVEVVMEEDEKDEDEDKDNIDKSKEEKAEDSKGEKGSKKRGRGKINGEKVKEKRKELKKTEPRTPTIDRPVRERKSVERLVASIDKDATKEFHIQKGRGTPLKDIPNVAFKLSRRKTDDTFKLLHTILFGRRGKAVEIKSNISRFSGFVWRDNEEKQMIKVKEKLDKCNKEKLLEFCDVLDITINKATTRKEDIIAKLIDFLVAPHATTTVLLAEKEKPSKGTKRKRVVKRGSSRSGTTSRRSVKRQKKNEDSTVARRKSASDTDESEEDKKDEENEEENEIGVADKSEDETPEKSESEDKSDSGSESEDTKEKKKPSKTSSTKKESAKKSKIEKITVATKTRSPHKRTPKKASFNLSKSDDDSDESPNPKVFSRKKKNEKGGKQKTDDDSDESPNPKVFSRKKKNEKGGKQKIDDDSDESPNPKVFSRKKNEKGGKQKRSTPTKSTSKEKTEKVTKGKGKKKEKSSPSDNQLRDAICKILKEVDFNTATFTDILKQLAKQFDMDLTPKKASIKLMIQEELTKLADEADDEEDGEEDAEKDEAPSTGQEVKA